tara:strand:- start:5796 stop:6050 length:255 start_codon:yes stop_codon:yes gene_type:complete
MYYVYILLSKKDDKFYTGCTTDLKKRVTMHNKKTIKSTQNRTPLKLVYYEAFLNREDAFQREKWLKTGWGRNHLKKTLKNYLKN